MEPPESSVAARVREVATARLTVADGTRMLALRALGFSGPESDGALATVLNDVSGYTVAERAEAARALGRLGERGQKALGEALGKLVPARDPLSLSNLVSDSFGPLSSTLGALTAPPPREARATLADLARLPVPTDGAPLAMQRRVVRLRCDAAKLLATSPDEPALLACDPDPGGQAGELARAAVLARGPIAGPKKKALLHTLALSAHPAVRGAALEAVASHRELDDAAAYAVQALGHAHAGTVASGAQIITQRPDLLDSVRPAGAAAPPDLGAAVLLALDKPWAPDDVETVASLLDAAGALRLTAARQRLEAACASPWPTLRAHAGGALDRLTEKSDKAAEKGADKAKCLDAPPSPLPAELLHPVSRPRLLLDTDAGELTIEVDGTVAPMAATRLVELARAGFYDGMAVHRVVPGFVVQFGDRGGDGTGGAGKESLRCETSPLPFGPLSVGVALSGRDTGSSQFFITLARTPHLDGEYTVLGTATGDWAAVAEGDLIRKITVRE